jgi:CHAT domain-containing protein
VCRAKRVGPSPIAALHRLQRVRASLIATLHRAQHIRPPLIAVFAAWLFLPLSAVAQQSTQCDVPRAETESPQSAAGAALARANEQAAAGDREQALAGYDEAERLARESGEDSLVLFANASAVRSLIDLGRIDRATEELDRAMTAIDDVEDPKVRARLRIHTGRSLIFLCDRSRAAATFSAASRDARLATDARLDSYALGYRAELYENAGRTEDALALTRRALFAAQRAGSPDALYRWQWQLARIQRSAGDSESALAAYRESVSTVKAVRQVASREVEPLYSGFVDLLLLRAAGARGDDQQALLRDARDAMEDFKAAELRDYFRDPCLDAQRKEASDTVPGALVVYPILLPDRLELVAGLGGVLTSYVVPVTRDALTAEVRAFRKTLEKRTTHQYLRHAHVLYEWLIRPLESAMASKGVDTLVFIPGGALRTIPIAALRDEKAKKFLIEKLPVAITPSLTLTNPTAIDRESVRLLAAGISESVQDYRPLPYVARELDAVTAVFPGRRLMDAEFVADRFESEISDQPFGIVHIASHGEFEADIAESFLLTYDGKLSMNELADLVGRTRFRVRGIELLTLSACQTAAGNDRAALGLAGVALRAGARSALATLWSVNDRAAAALVIEFYTQLGNPEISRAEALRRAQMKTLQNHAYRHPSYWSPYLLISSWL